MSDALPQPGDIIDGAYRLEGMLGQGGFGVVYRATQLSVGRAVALKMLLTQDADPQLQARFFQEATAAARLQHPNVVVIHDFGIHQDQLPYIVMELLDGHDLGDELDLRGPMSAQRIAALMAPCLEGLAQAHRQGVVHKDLKPSNLFVHKPGQRGERLKLVDFGVAHVRREVLREGRAPTRMTQPGQSIGTPLYMAPEYLEHQLVSPAIDVYQMGLIMAELITAQPVVEGQGWWSCALVHIRGELKIAAQVRASALWPVISAAISTDPNGRYPDAAAMLGALERAVGRGSHPSVLTFDTFEASAITQDPVHDALATDAVAWTMPGGGLIAHTPLSPSLGGRFVGRGGLMETLREHLLDAPKRDGQPRQVALTANGGMGKTRLAIEFAWRHLNRFPGGVFWVDASDPTRRDESLHHILRHLEPAAPPLAALLERPQSLDDLLRRALLRLPRATEVLWVVDNLPVPDSGQQGQPLLHWCPALGQVPVLLTSRMRRPEMAVINLQVPPLGQDDGAALLATGFEDSGWSRQEAQQVVDWVDGLPLALELLNRSLVLGELGAGELVSLVEAGQEGVTQVLDARHRALSPQLGATALPGVTETLLLSFGRLTPKAQSLACALAHMAPAPLPRTLVMALADTGTASLLVAHNILTRSPGAFLGVMHRVVADFLRGQDVDGQGRRAALEALLDALESDKDGHHPYRWARLAESVPHASALLEQGGSEPSERLVRLALHLGELHRVQGRFEAAADVLRKAVVLAREVGGSESALTLEALFGLAVALWFKGNHQGAERLHGRVLEVRRRTLGAHHPQTLCSMEQLSVALKDRGELGRALALRQEVYAARLEALGPKDAQTLEGGVMLASALRASGHLAQAEALGRQSLEVAREVFGLDHPIWLRVANNLASTLQAQGQLDEANALHRQVVEGRGRWLGSDHPETLWSQRQRLRGLMAAQRLEEAAALAPMILDTRRRRLGSDHPEVLRSALDLAQVHVLAQDHTRALRTLKALAPQALARLGDDHPDRREINALRARLEAQLEAQ